MPSKTFETRLKDDFWIEIPKKIMDGFGGRVRVKVRATLNGFTFRTTIFSMKGCVGIPVRRDVQHGAGIGPGLPVKVELEEDLAPRKVTVPAALRKALGTKATRAAFESLSYTRRKELVAAINEAKKPETKASRVQKAVDAARAPKQ
jgi:hypothetical protein